MKEQTQEICEAAIKQNSEAKQYINSQVNTQPVENPYQLPKDFDRDAFINEIEICIDYGNEISQDDYDLYQRLVEERAAEEAMNMDFDVDMEM